MPTILVSMVKDEADIVETWVRYHATQVDAMIVADNMSTDGTRETLDKLAEEFPIQVIDDLEIAYYQSQKLSNLAGMALDQGASWVLAVDADEMWMSPHGRLGDILEAHTPDYGLVTAELYDHVATGLDDPYNFDPVRRMGWRRTAPLPLHKVACRAEAGLVIEMGNHFAHHRIPARFTETPALVCHHYPYRSVEQLIKKVRNGSAAYKAATNLHSSTGAHWRQWGEFSDEQIKALFEYWYFRANPREPIVLEGEEQPPLLYDPFRCPI